MENLSLTASSKKRGLFAVKAEYYKVCRFRIGYSNYSFVFLPLAVVLSLLGSVVSVILTAAVLIKQDKKA